MPVHPCTHAGKPGWQWGQQKCYTGPGAKRKAAIQGSVIERSGYKGNAAPNPLRMDPTRTATLRRQFETELTRRFNRLQRAINDLLVVEDALGLTTNARWAFHTAAQQVEAFQRWLAQRIQADIYLGAKATEEAYWQAYVEEGYRKGAGRAFDDANKAGLYTTTEKLDFYRGTKEQFLRSAFGRPVAVEKVKLLASRTLTDLKGVTDAMATVMSRTLTDGLVQGKNPREIARDLTKALDSVGRTRALTIARTEIIRAHAEGQLDALEEMGVDEVGVMVEWATAGFNVCPLCEALSGSVMTVKEARGLIPRHPNCRCAYIPANVGESKRGQKRGKATVTKALESSLRQEGPKRGISLESLRKRSTWAGADRTIAKQRPRSRV